MTLTSCLAYEISEVKGSDFLPRLPLSTTSEVKARVFHQLRSYRVLWYPCVKSPTPTAYPILTKSSKVSCFHRYYRVTCLLSPSAGAQQQQKSRLLPTQHRSPVLPDRPARAPGFRTKWWKTMNETKTLYRVSLFTLSLVIFRGVLGKRSFPNTFRSGVWVIAIKYCACTCYILLPCIFVMPFK